MFNLWKRSYVHTFNQRNAFDSKTIMADAAYANTMFIQENFYDGGSLVHQGSGIDEIINKHYGGKVANLFVKLRGQSDTKWAVVVNHEDYYYLLACYLKELQHSFKFGDDDLHLLAFSFAYDNFYYANDARFVDGFVNGAYLGLMKAVFETYQPSGVLDLVKVVDLPTEIGYFLVKRDIVPEADIHANFVNAAKMIVTRLWQVHFNDFSEWLVLDTKHFLNMMKSSTSPEVTSDTITFDEMQAYIQADPYLKSMFFQAFPFFTSNANWTDDPNFKVTASRIVTAWQKLADYLVARGLDADWAKLRHSQYTEIILRYDYVKTNCDVVKYLLELDDAPEALDRPIIDMMGYDILSECMDNKYNKTLLLLTLRGMSPSFQGFVDKAFGE